MKNCIKCNKSKPTSSFTIRNNGNIRGECKKCTAAIARKYRKDNKEKLKLQAARANYNITIAEAERLYSKEHCDICSKFIKIEKNKHIDHCHTTKEIRGTLCSNCNRALGYFKDDIEILKKAIKYLKASRLHPMDL